MASLVNLTPKYLSALFHKETGQTLTVFIHKVLIEKAKNLLEHSSTHILYISFSNNISIWQLFYFMFLYFSLTYFMKSLIII